MKHPYRTAALASAVLVSLGLSSAAFAGGRPDLVLSGLKAGRGHEADQLLVKFRDGSTAAQQNAVRQGLGAQKLDTVRGGNAKKGELALLKMPAGRDLASAIKHAERQSGRRIRRAELDLPAQRHLQRHLLHQRFAVGHVRRCVVAGQPVRLAGRRGLGRRPHRLQQCRRRRHRRRHLLQPRRPRRQHLDQSVRCRPTASTTTATATSTTSAAGTSTAAATTSTPVAPTTTTARTWRARSPASAATARAWPACAGAASS